MRFRREAVPPFPRACPEGQDPEPSPGGVLPPVPVHVPTEVGSGRAGARCPPSWMNGPKWVSGCDAQSIGEARLQGVAPFGSPCPPSVGWTDNGSRLSWASASSRGSPPTPWGCLRNPSPRELGSVRTRGSLAGLLHRVSRVSGLAGLLGRLPPFLRFPTLSYRFFGVPCGSQGGRHVSDRKSVV